MLTERERQEVRRTAKRHRAQPGIVNNASIPNKGTNDNNGNPFLGLTRQKIADLTLTEAEQADNSTTTRVLASNVHSNDPLGNANMNQDPSRAVSGDATKTKTLEGHHLKDATLGARVFAVGLGGLSGKVGRGQVEDFLNGDRLIREGTLPTTALASRPWSGKTAPDDVRRIVRDMVKAASLR